MAEQEYKRNCGNCQIRIYIQRHEGIVLTWQNCPYTCPYAMEMRCSTEAKENTINDPISRQAVKETIEALPPSPSETVRINLNEPIKVKLTDWGKEIYYHRYDRINKIAGRKICKPEFPKEDENGYTEFQLWCFIELYGEYTGMALPNVIEPLEIVYERRAE